MEEPDMAGWQIGGPNSRQESAHFKVCLRQRGGFLAAPIHWLLTAQQVRSCRLNCYDLNILNQNHLDVVSLFI